MIHPRLLAILIIFSFLLVLLFIGGASEPISVQGATFWISFVVFAFGCAHLSKNDKYYKKYIDELP
jgi:hypothetical protein